MDFFILVALPVLQICAVKVRKNKIFLENFPLKKFHKVDTKSLVFEFSKLFFK